MADTQTSYLRTLYTDPVSKNARAIFEQGDWHFEPHPALANFIWMRNAYQPLIRKLRTDQMLNHIPNEQAIYDKGHLTRHLQVFDKLKKGQDLALGQFFPETYCLYRKEDCRAFLEKIPAKDTPDNLWILKPTQESRGIGIQILWQLGKLKERLLYPGRKIPDLAMDPSRRYVIQRYIKNPLLLHGYKSEIRLYWLVACFDPLLVLIYKEGTVRRNASLFRLADFDNPLVHLTNIYQQIKHHPDPESLVLKWTFAQLQRYLTSDLKRAETDFVERELKPHWKKILSFVVFSALKTLRRKPDRGFFWGLYGADLILDSDLRSWLTEVQFCPGLSHIDIVKKEVIPGMMCEAAEIVLEVQQRKRTGRSLAQLEAVNGFEWVINEAS